MISGKNEDINDQYRQINENLLAYLVPMLKVLITRGKLPPVSETHALGQIIFDMCQCCSFV
ncbi:hypothetical protein BN2476_630134 [Paraburkholderia piptadeniae]|uniref:Uncharacterized protein n=1 Tax=Paraburkholderia piptadeniae TaxID=1701573 RepID=A0A1N7SLV3_9BURK|nr:hypothetical protein BN2476_630134 [Paraburkholderia piptadeniae]